MYDFNKEIERRNTTSIKWNKQNAFGQKSGLLPFWIADTDFASVPDVLDDIKKRCDHPLIGYSEPMPTVKTSIQGWWERRFNWKPETDWMLLSYGVVTGIFFTLNEVVPKNGKVLVFTPVYDPFFAAVNNSGHTLVKCELEHNDNQYSINFISFEKELKNGIEAVVLCNPHNPVGRVWTNDEMERIVNLCVKYNVYLLSDEIHADLGLIRKYTTAGKFTQMYKKLIVYTAISKTFNMAGLGSSCMIIPNSELKKKISDAYDACWMFGPSDLAFTAIESAYTHGDIWVDEQLEHLKSNMGYVVSFITEKMPEVQVTKHEGTFLMWLDMRCLKMSSTKMTTILAKEYGLALGDGSHYGDNCDGFMRLNIGCTKKTLTKGLEQMAIMYNKYIK